MAGPLERNQARPVDSPNDLPSGGHRIDDSILVGRVELDRMTNPLELVQEVAAGDHRQAIAIASVELEPVDGVKLALGRFIHPRREQRVARTVATHEAKHGRGDRASDGLARTCSQRLRIARESVHEHQGAHAVGVVEGEAQRHRDAERLGDDQRSAEAGIVETLDDGIRQAGVRVVTRFPPVVLVVQAPESIARLPVAPCAQEQFARTVDARHVEHLFPRTREALPFGTQGSFDSREGLHVAIVGEAPSSCKPTEKIAESPCPSSRSLDDLEASSRPLDSLAVDLPHDHEFTPKIEVVFQAFDPRGEDSAIGVLDPPTWKRPPEKPRLQRIPPSEPPDFFGGFGGDDDGDDSSNPGPDGRAPNDTARFGLVLVMLGSSVMFAVMIAVYTLFSLTDSHPETGRALPNATWIATALLLASSFSIHRADQARGAGRPNRARRLVKLTMVLGLAFLVAQGFLWRELAVLGLLPKLGPTVSLFWAVTAMHALHAALGIGTFAYVLRRRELVHAPPATQVPYFGVAASFWHFVGVLWTALFGAVFLLG